MSEPIEHITPTDAAGPHHEPSEVNLRGTLLTVATVLLGVAVVAAITLWSFDYFARLALTRDPMLSPIPYEEKPPAVELQATPNRELIEYREREQRLLETYGWVDKQQGRVHIPIGRAMAMILERGLPTAQKSEPPLQEQPASEDKPPAESGEPEEQRE